MMWHRQMYIVVNSVYSGGGGGGYDVCLYMYMDNNMYTIVTLCLFAFLSPISTITILSMW